MPDHIDPIPAAQGQTDWPAMLHDLEKRVEVLSDALDGVKLSMRRLVLAEPWLEQAITSFAAEQPQHPAHMPPVAMAEPEPPVAYESVASYEAPPAYEAPQAYDAAPVYDAMPAYSDAPSYSFDPPAYEAAPPVEEQAPPASYDEDAREAVRRAVEEAKAQMASGELRDETPDYPPDVMSLDLRDEAPSYAREETSDYVTEDKPEVSWITLPDDGSEPEPLPIFDEPIAEYAPDEEAHEAVRRAVDETMAEAAYGDLSYGEAAPRAVEAVETPPELDEEAEDLRRVVEQMYADGRGGQTADEDSQPLAVGSELVESEPVESEAEEPEDPREAVRRAVEAAKAEMATGKLWANDESPVAEAQAEDPHEAARRAVEQAKADLGMPGYGISHFEAPEMPESEPQVEAPAAFNDDEAAREAVRQAVEEAKAERSFADNAIGTMSEEDAAREAVRQAVARARTEMATTGSIAEVEPEPVAKKPAFVVPPPHRAERVHPPTLTIEDPEGRVELARVYNLLKRLDVAANSSLLNYSSRQVAVQLSDSKVAPEGEDVGNAVRAVFERENDVSVDGLNVIVKLGGDYVQAA